MYSADDNDDLYTFLPLAIDSHWRQSTYNVPKKVLHGDWEVGSGYGGFIGGESRRELKEGP